VLQRGGYNATEGVVQNKLQLLKTYRTWGPERIHPEKYGLIVADNGLSWYITGAPDSRWDDNDLDQLKQVPGSAFEVVSTGPIQTQ
jgi:hypothetical protein